MVTDDDDNESRLTLGGFSARFEMHRSARFHKYAFLL